MAEPLLELGLENSSVMKSSGKELLINPQPLVLNRNELPVQTFPAWMEVQQGRVRDLWGSFTSCSAGAGGYSSGYSAFPKPFVGISFPPDGLCH